jgi:phosphoglycolate phosphatase-like HAD superfamily hydrolase
MRRVQVFDVNETLLDLAALGMLAEQTGTELGDDDRQAIAGQLRRLPAHPEVPAALERLRGAGFQLVALTNSTLEVARAQLDHAGLIDLFDQVLSEGFRSQSSIGTRVTWPSSATLQPGLCATSQRTPSGSAK